MPWAAGPSRCCPGSPRSLLAPPAAPPPAQSRQSNGARSSCVREVKRPLDSLGSPVEIPALTSSPRSCGWESASSRAASTTPRTTKSRIQPCDSDSPPPLLALALRGCLAVALRPRVAPESADRSDPWRRSDGVGRAPGPLSSAALGRSCSTALMFGCGGTETEAMEE